MDKKSKLPKWIIENLKEGFTNLTVDDAVHYGKVFLKQMAQKFTKVRLKIYLQKKINKQ